MSIIFHLDQELKVYRTREFVNDAEIGLELVAGLSKGSERILNLFERFEFLWVDMFERGELENEEKIYFVVGSRAGFTDTRVVYLWIKSWSVFEGQKVDYWIYKTSEEVELDKISVLDLKKFLLKIESANQKDLVYSKGPSIGRG